MTLTVWVFLERHSQFTGQEGKGEAISLIPLHSFHLLQRHLDISWAITAWSSLLCIVRSRARTGNLWFLNTQLLATCPERCLHDDWMTPNTGRVNLISVMLGSQFFTSKISKHLFHSFVRAFSVSQQQDRCKLWSYKNITPFPDIKLGIQTLG